MTHFLTHSLKRCYQINGFSFALSCLGLQMSSVVASRDRGEDEREIIRINQKTTSTGFGMRWARKDRAREHIKQSLCQTAPDMKEAAFLSLTWL